MKVFRSFIIALFLVCLGSSTLSAKKAEKSKTQTYTQTPDEVFKTATHLVETKYQVTLVNSRDRIISFVEKPRFGNGMVTWQCTVSVFADENNKTQLSFTGMGTEGIKAQAPSAYDRSPGADFQRASASFGSLSGPSDDNPRKAFYKDMDKYLSAK